MGPILFLSTSLLFNCASQYLNSPYKWQENGPFYFDCSGLVVRAIRDYERLSGRFVEPGGFKDKTSQGIYDWLLKENYMCSPPSEGSLLFYGPSVFSITHVAIMGPKNVVLESGGAGRETLHMAHDQLIWHCTEKDARVRYRNFGHRNDLVASIRFEKF